MHFLRRRNAGCVVVGGYRSRVAHCVEGSSPPAQRLCMARVVLEYTVEVLHRCRVSTETDRVVSGAQQPFRGAVRATSFEPVVGDCAWTGAELGQPTSCVSVHGDGMVGRQLIRQGAPHELVAKAVLTLVRDQHIGGNGGVEQSSQFLFGATGDGNDRGEVERTTDQRKSPQPGENIDIKVEEATTDCVGE